MNGLLRACLSVTGLFLCVDTLLADGGSVSQELRIESERLGYALQYRVYTPPGYADYSALPTIYVTDGQWYLGQGQMDQVLDNEITSGSIDPVVAVFLDNRNPDNLTENRRNSQFFCVSDYVDFFKHELVPAITRDYKVSDSQADRVILGVSFGGLNSACFGVMADDVFGGIAMQSPAMHPVASLHDQYRDKPKRPIKVFLSVGDENEITRRSLKLKRVLEEKGYPLMFKQNSEGHNWRNWQPLLDDMLVYFFKKP
jgi:enterochelin esterase-like enzyme